MSLQADVLIWDFKTREIIHRCSLHKERVQSIAFSPTDKFLVSLGGQDDNSVLVWDVSTGQAVCGSAPSQRPATGFAETITYANTTDFLFMTGGDQVLRVWEIDPKTLKVCIDRCDPLWTPD